MMNPTYFRERFALGGGSRFGGFLSLIALFNQHFAFARGTRSSGIGDYGVHGRVVNVRLADRAGERMVVKVESDGAHLRSPNKIGLLFYFAPMQGPAIELAVYATREN